MMAQYRMVMANVMSMLVRDSKVNTTALNRTCEGHCIDEFVSDVIDVETKLANVSSRRGWAAGIG